MFRQLIFVILLTLPLASFAQSSYDDIIRDRLPEVIEQHREFVSIPNVASDTENMMRNIEWAQYAFSEKGFEVRLLQTSSLPVFLAERKIDDNAPTVLYYLHIDGQAVDADNWDQPDPFVPVLKEMNSGNWDIISWDNIQSSEIDPDWRIFGRAAADDKAPITMMLTAIDILDDTGMPASHNIKVILDPQEEAGSEAFLSSLDTDLDAYEADYMIILDGPAHPSNQPTLTFGCRGIATCSIKVYGSELPQHSGHYGNYVPNPVFRLAHLLDSMKDTEGKVLIDGYYNGIDISAEESRILAAVPDNRSDINRSLGIAEAEKVGSNYQDALQYPSLNVRHIETSWKGPGLKTIIPEYAVAHLDVRLVKETDGAEQLNKIRSHIESEGYYVLDREPTTEERLRHPDIATFISDPGVNAFRTELDSNIGLSLSDAIKNEFGKEPVKIRSMGGTVPIIPAINSLNIPAIIVPTVNMDNNQHNPNENIRIGNIQMGIRMLMAILTAEL
ncbi:M20/M25/M40 family metallo-hydrolase [Balneola sp. MJW-20]|uniref:M20/M25/M40 family metallo-hydrolase n=1 Tax=Gracilimonas aurantiaca TaxID=3234185 RepID=UPI0034667BB1